MYAFSAESKKSLSLKVAGWHDMHRQRASEATICICRVCLFFREWGRGRDILFVYFTVGKETADQDSLVLSSVAVIFFVESNVCCGSNRFFSFNNSSFVSAGTSTSIFSICSCISLSMGTKESSSLQSLLLAVSLLKFLSSKASGCVSHMRLFRELMNSVHWFTFVVFRATWAEPFSFFTDNILSSSALMNRMSV